MKPILATPIRTTPSRLKPIGSRSTGASLITVARLWKGAAVVVGTATIAVVVGAGPSDGDRTTPMNPATANQRDPTDHDERPKTSSCGSRSCGVGRRRLTLSCHGTLSGGGHLEQMVSSATGASLHPWHSKVGGTFPNATLVSMWRWAGVLEVKPRAVPRPCRDQRRRG